jgi:PadR family transcriptional regulator, regulatory protein PadR
MKECGCDMRGMLSFLLLFLLSKKPMYGHQISKEIEIRKGCRPSPGTLYPALKELGKHGLIKDKKEGREVLYSITKEGNNAYKEAKKQFCAIFRDVI